MVRVNRQKLLVSLVASILLFIPVVTLAELDVKISQKSLTAYSGTTQSINATIENNRNVSDTYSMTIFPPYAFKISASLSESVLNMAPNSKQTIQLTFIIPECAEEATPFFFVTAKSITDETVQASSSVILSVMRKFYICLSDLKLSSQVISPGESVSIITSITNPTESASLPLTLEATIKNEEGQTVQSFVNRIETIDGKTTKSVKNTYTFDKYTKAGSYLAEVVLRDENGKEINRLTKPFRISSVETVTTDRSLKYGLLAQTIMVTVKNEGNTPIFDYPVSESIVKFMRPFFFPRTEPDLEEVKDNRIVYTWIIPKLNPGEERDIIYDVSVWNAWILVIVIGAIVYVSFKYVFTLKITKKHRHIGALTKEKEIPILLEVKNHSRHEIKDIIVRDFVPSLATVVEKFDTLRPTLRKIPGGTELIWRLDYLRPGEERVITYKIKPRLEIMGTLKLPKAYMKFLDKKKELKKKVSKNIVIKSE